ncbi:MAG: group II intron maturase-specific domain-containing protein, partial [Crocosphaera sp.]
WTLYHNGSVSSKIFATIDNWLYELQAKWIKRRTPRMSKKNRAKEYFGRFNPKYPNQKWAPMKLLKLASPYQLYFSNEHPRGTQATGSLFQDYQRLERINLTWQNKQKKNKNEKKSS